MKKTLDITAIIIVLFYLSVGMVQAQERGWMLISTDKIEADKQMHFVGHTAVGFTSYLIFETMDFTNEFSAAALSLTTSNILGFWKEFADKKTTGFDWQDIKYNNLGAITGIALSWLLRKRAKRIINSSAISVTLNGVRL